MEQLRLASSNFIDRSNRFTRQTFIRFVSVTTLLYYFVNSIRKQLVVCNDEKSTLPVGALSNLLRF